MPIPPVLFIHGAANGAWVWDAWRRQLSALGHQPIVIDLRGHGRSLPVDFSEITMDDYVHDVESVTTQVEARLGSHPVIAGWSMGGLIAML
ncbi:MAG: alpha/beta hydrolase, partial [Dehalococcoidia bacterium]